MSGEVTFTFLGNCKGWRINLSLALFQDVTLFKSHIDFDFSAVELVRRRHWKILLHERKSDEFVRRPENVTTT
jgi:hypothetical protein